MQSSSFIGSFKNVKANTHQNKTNRNKQKCDTCLCKRAVFDIIKDRTDISYLNLIHKIIPKNDVNRSLRHEYWSNSRKTFFFLISPIWLSWKFYFCYFEKKRFRIEGLFISLNSDKSKLYKLCLALFKYKTSVNCTK